MTYSLWCILEIFSSGYMVQTLHGLLRSCWPRQNDNCVRLFSVRFDKSWNGCLGCVEHPSVQMEMTLRMLLMLLPAMLLFLVIISLTGWLHISHCYATDSSHASGQRRRTLDEVLSADNPCRPGPSACLPTDPARRPADSRQPIANIGSVY